MEIVTIAPKLTSEFPDIQTLEVGSTQRSSKSERKYRAEWINALGAAVMDAALLLIAG